MSENESPPKIERPPISFEKFVEIETNTGQPRYRNFFAYFDDPDKNSMTMIYRKKTHFLAFAKHHVEVLSRLESKFKNRDARIALPDFAATIADDLYEAYLLMRNYVESDGVLFT